MDSPVSSTGQAQVKCGMTTGRDDKGFLSLPPACPVGRLAGSLSVRMIPDPEASGE
ncbi:MAG: hypothetical protein V3R54_09210 [Thermodesulfovibrionia bacterium]